MVKADEAEHHREGKPGSALRPQFAFGQDRNRIAPGRTAVPEAETRPGNIGNVPG